MQKFMQVEITLRCEGQKDIRVQMTLILEDNEVKTIICKQLMTIEEMN
jgi:hypothetical protein